MNSWNAKAILAWIATATVRSLGVLRQPRDDTARGFISLSPSVVQAVELSR